MKKILSYVLLAAMLVGCMIPALVINAADDAKITATTADPMWRDETFTSTVEITNNPAISYLKFIIYYKVDDISEVGLSYSDALFAKDDASATEPTNGSHKSVKKWLSPVLGTTDNDELDKYKAAVVTLERTDDDGESVNITGDGKLFDAIFTINGTPANNAVLSGGIVIMEAMNADGETVTINPNAVTTNATVKPDPYVGIHDELTMFVAGPQTIPYGTKKVSVDIRLDANKEGLWGGQLYIAYNSKWNVDFNAVEKTGTGIVNGNLWAGVGATSTYNIVSYDAENSKRALVRCNKYDEARDMNANVISVLLEKEPGTTVDFEGGIVLTVNFDVPADAKVGDQLKIMLATVGDFVVKKNTESDTAKGIDPKLEDLTITIAAVACDHTRTHENVIEPTCEKDGETQIVCDECGAVISSTPIPAPGHNWVKGATHEPNCKDEGYTEYTCSVCQQTKRDDIVPANGQHVWVEGTPVPATCAEDGYTPWTCSVCGDEEKRDIVSKETVDHTPGEPQTTPATCTEDGRTVVKCTVCGTVISDEIIPSPGHKWVEGDTVGATCTEKGYTEYECSVCHETKQDNFKDPLGHDEATEDKEPTCTEDGYHKVYCKRCNEVLTNEVKPKLGHTEAAPIVKKVPTCTEDGYTTVSCARCGTLLHESYPAKLGHQEKIVINEPATYDADGHIKIVCERCDEVLRDEVLPRLTVSATVKCIITNGNDVTVISETTTDGLYKGDSFKAQRPEIPGYTPTDDGAEKEIQLGETDNVIYFEFTANTDITYTVKYVDENGKELAPAKVVKDQTMASTVTEKAIEIKGYTADAAEKTLTLAADGNEIVFTYKADKVDDGGKGTTNPDNNSKPNGNSQTGDNFIFVVIALVIAAAGAATVVIVRRKRQH